MVFKAMRTKTYGMSILNMKVISRLSYLALCPVVGGLHWSHRLSECRRFNRTVRPDNEPTHRSDMKSPLFESDKRFIKLCEDYTNVNISGNCKKIIVKFISLKNSQFFSYSMLRRRIKLCGLCHFKIRTRMRIWVKIKVNVELAGWSRFCHTSA